MATHINNLHAAHLHVVILMQRMAMYLGEQPV